MKNKLLLALIVFFGFFLVGLITLSDYGINWDEPVHLRRGQAYLHYFLTGKTDYSDFETTPPIRRSYFQIDSQSASFFLEHDKGHPPLNGILAAFTNYIFYQQLGIMGDIESHHLFVLLVSSLLVLLVFLFAAQEYGLLAGIVASLSLALYPLFLAESHFNIKDPIEAVLFTLTIYGFYQGVKQKSWQWFFTSALASGCALGTKFNVLFVPFIIMPWLVVRFWDEIMNLKQKIVFKIIRLPRKIFLALLFYPLIVFSIFFLSWPYLWQDPIINFWSIFRYYKQMGSGVTSQPLSFYFFGFNTYPIQSVLFTTPLVVLFFSFWGTITSLFLFKKEKNKPSFLFLLWFLLPIIRVSLPGASIYGGTRQIMEYIPAMALLAGLGAKYVVEKIPKQVRNDRLLAILVILMFLPITLKMIQIHPNQNVYFNPLIGGLAGAKEKDYPFWGLTLGSVYKQGVEWLNQNAEEGARVALVIGTAPNIPKIYFRDDIRFHNGFWSGSRREGEYLIEAVFKDWIRVWYYCGEHVDRLLKPVYEVKVDGVPILKIWQNDWEHVYPQYRQEEQLAYQVNWQVEDNQIFLELPEERELMKISWTFDERDCSALESGQVFRSTDGLNWLPEGEWIRDRRVGGIDMVERGRINYPLAAKVAKYVKIQVKPENACPLKIKKLMVDVIAPIEL